MLKDDEESKEKLEFVEVIREDSRRQLESDCEEADVSIAEGDVAEQGRSC